MTLQLHLDGGATALPPCERPARFVVERHDRHLTTFGRVTPLGLDLALYEGAELLQSFEGMSERGLQSIVDAARRSGWTVA